MGWVAWENITLLGNKLRLTVLGSRASIHYYLILKLFNAVECLNQVSADKGVYLN